MVLEATSRSGHRQVLVVVALLGCALVAGVLAAPPAAAVPEGEPFAVTRIPVAASVGGEGFVGVFNDAPTRCNGEDQLYMQRMDQGLEVTGPQVSLGTDGDCMSAEAAMDADGDLVAAVSFRSERKVTLQFSNFSEATVLDTITTEGAP